MSSSSGPAGGAGDQVVLVISSSRTRRSDLGADAARDGRYIFARPTTDALTETDGADGTLLSFDPTSYDSFVRVFQQAVARNEGRLDALVLDLTDLRGANGTAAGGSSFSAASVTSTSSSTDESGVLVDGSGSGSGSHLQGEALTRHLEAAKVPLETSLGLWALKCALWYIQKSPKAARGGRPPKIVVVANEALDPHAASATTRDQQEIIGSSSVIGTVRSLAPVHGLAAKIRMSLIQQPLGESRGVDQAIQHALSETSPVDLKTTPVIYQRRADGTFAPLAPGETNIAKVDAYATLGVRFGVLMIVAGLANIVSKQVRAHSTLVAPASAAAVAYLWAKGWIPKPLVFVLGFAISQAIVGRYVRANKRGAKPQAAASGGRTSAPGRPKQEGETTSTGVFLGSGEK